jgi:hypothetical protein
MSTRRQRLGDVKARRQCRPSSPDHIADAEARRARAGPRRWFAVARWVEPSTAHASGIVFVKRDGKITLVEPRSTPSTVRHLRRHRAPPTLLAGASSRDLLSRLKVKSTGLVPLVNLIGMNTTR